MVRGTANEINHAILPSLYILKRLEYPCTNMKEGREGTRKLTSGTSAASVLWSAMIRPSRYLSIDI
jgi:hypothetical protein